MFRALRVTGIAIDQIIKGRFKTYKPPFASRNRMKVIHQQKIIANNITCHDINTEEECLSGGSKSLLTDKFAGFSKHELPDKGTSSGIIPPANR